MPDDKSGHRSSSNALPDWSGHSTSDLPPLPKLQTFEGRPSWHPAPWDCTSRYVARLSESRRKQLLKAYQAQFKRDIDATDEPSATFRHNSLRRAIGMLLTPAATGAKLEPWVSAPRAHSRGPALRANERMERVQRFLKACNDELPFKVIKRHIWQAAKHKKARQFERWQAGDKASSRQDDVTFPRILSMSPKQFHRELWRLKIPGVPAIAVG
jgi:hypothetical protein